jgi:hypothetical protein
MSQCDNVLPLFCWRAGQFSDLIPAKNRFAACLLGIPVEITVLYVQLVSRARIKTERKTLANTVYCLNTVDFLKIDGWFG